MGTIGTWLPLVFRVLVVSQLAVPALSKFVNPAGEVRFFSGPGLPSPELLVPLVGAFEVAALVAVLLGAAGRLASPPLVVIMLVAVLAADPNAANMGVLIGSLGVTLLGTGPYSLWTPEDRLFPGRSARQP